MKKFELIGNLVFAILFAVMALTCLAVAAQGTLVQMILAAAVAADMG